MVVHLTVGLERVLGKGFTLDLRIAEVGLLWPNVNKWMHTPLLLNGHPGMQREMFLCKT